MTAMIERSCSSLWRRHSACSSRERSLTQALISARTPLEGASLSFSILVMRVLSSLFSHERTCEMILELSAYQSVFVDMLSAYCCSKFMPSSAPDDSPIQFVTALTLTFASTILITPLIIVATLPTLSVCLTTLYGSMPCTLPIMRSKVGPSGESTSV